MAAPSNFTFSDAANLASAGVSILNAGVSAYLPYAQLSEGIKAAGAQKAAGIYQRGLFEVQAIDTLALANIRADQEEKIATLAGRSPTATGQHRGAQLPDSIQQDAKEPARH
jgi:hypothetical protein